MGFSRCWLGAVAGLWLGVSGSASALDMVVDTTADGVDVSPGDGVCATSGGSCSLRAAVMEANAWSADPVDTISVPAGTYTLTLTGADEEAAATGDLDINSAITITSQAGAAVTIIDGNGTDRIFDIAPGSAAGNLTLTGFTLTGGALGSSSPAWPDGVSNVRSVHGGAIRVQGQLTVNSSVIDDNQVSGDGGAIQALFGNIEIVDSTIRNNRALGFGSAIFIQSGALSILNSHVEDNFVADFPGTIAGGGLAIFDARVYIEGSTFSGHKVFRDGGAIYFAVGDLTIVNSTFSNNRATRFGGAIYVSGGSNSSGTDWFKSVKLSNVTVAFNQADAIDNEQPAIGHPGAGGIYLNNLGTVAMSNTLVAGNNIGGDCYVASGGAVVSLGFNLDGDGACGLSEPGDISGAGSDWLSPLADNGGPTPTVAIDATSPAVDNGSDVVCAANGLVDQRGYVRPDAGCDIGAFELGGDSGIAPPPSPPGEPEENLAPVALNMVIALNGGGAYAGLLNAADPNGDELTFEIEYQVGPPNESGYGMGLLTSDPNDAPGTFVYRDDISNPVDFDMFTYRACDPWRCSNTAQVQVLINRSQAATNLPTLEVQSSTGNVNPDGVTVVSAASLEAITGGIDYTYPVGGLVLSVTDVPVDGAGAGEATVTLQFPPEAEITADAVVRKLDLFGQWRTLASSQPLDPLTGNPIVATWAQLDVASRTVTLHLADNDGVFDRNPAVGVIDDPVTLAVPKVVDEAPSTSRGGSNDDVAPITEGGSGAIGWWALLLAAMWLRRR